jgi:chromosome segregation protein
VARLGGVLQERVAALRAAEGARDDARRGNVEAVSRLQQLEVESASAARDASARAAELQREEAAHAELLGRADELRLEMSQVEERLSLLRAAAGRHGEDQQASQERVQQLATEVARLERERGDALTQVGDARLSLTRRQGSERELSGRAERLAAMESELAELVRRRQEEAAQLAANLTQWRETSGQREAELSGLFADRDLRAEAVGGARHAIDGQRSQLEAAQQATQAIIERQKAKADALHELETRMTRATLTVQNAEERIMEKFQTTVAAGVAAIAAGDLPGDLIREGDSYPAAQVEELLGDRRDRMDKLGPVNFTALEEYESKKSRLQFLEKQRDDLLASKADLLQAIDRINKTARQLFQETFDRVRANFREIFSTLFEGGESDLELLKSEDPLESEIVIHARPRGKRVDSVALLSGGERALTAIALLFAVYLIKPSPFCLLDEVDAPLDDVNVTRFVRLLRTFSDRTQFIVITHNKLTMEAADHLYGVTMEENGVSRLVSVTFDEVDADDPLKALQLVARRRAQQESAAAASGAAASGVAEQSAMSEEGELATEAAAPSSGELTAEA